MRMDLVTSISVTRKLNWKARTTLHLTEDGDSFHFDLCERCFKELVNKVKSMQAPNAQGA
ncbi:hypothetical protein ADS78_04830 [Idiomarina abyssalis]|nr:hypothetical protein ADS78_04830 [Idiomarina abyssalis]